MLSFFTSLWYITIIAPFLFVGICATERRIALPLAKRSDFMDLNYLYRRYAVSLRRSEDAACVSSRAAHRELAAGYASQIELAKIHGTSVPA